MKRIILSTAIFISIAAPAIAGKITRHCDAKIHWETTGGSVSGNYAKKMASHLKDQPFSAPGTCGKSKANKCRQRAKATIIRCLAAHRNAYTSADNPPEFPSECNSMKNYDYSFGTIAKKDFKKRLDAEVCCRNHESYPYRPENNVRVKVWAQTSGQNKHCNGRVDLHNDLKVNCTAARRACPDIKD